MTTSTGKIVPAESPPRSPGHSWLETINRPTPEAFAVAFTPDVALDTSVASRPIVGPVAVRHFFDATRTMYDTINFTREMSVGSLLAAT